MRRRKHRADKIIPLDKDPFMRLTRVVVGGVVVMMLCEMLAERFISHYVEHGRAARPLAIATLLYGVCVLVFAETVRRSAIKHATLNALWQVAGILGITAITVYLGEPLERIEVIGVSLAVLACACFAV